MIEQLIHLDQELLLAVNQLTGNTYLDKLMVLTSAKWVWVPFYAFLLYSLYKHYGSNSLVWVVLGAFSLIVLSDQGSVQLFKEVFHRLRPCHNPTLMSELFLPSGNCGGQFGFISSHAANVFGLSAFTIVLMGKRTKLWYLMIIWASIVSFSRVYLAVHYPADILVGAMFGLLLGTGIGTIVQRQVKGT
ncbi:phosphatase PAP2 family protein [PVC group bacterium]|nr:phosphatase PAP2 family protein [PVC group bacterium]